MTMIADDNRDMICPYCEGTGKLAKGFVTTSCYACLGKGRITERRREALLRGQY